MKVVGRIEKGRQVAQVELTKEEELEFEALSKDPRFKLWRKYLGLTAGIHKDRLFARVLEGRKDYDPTAGVAYMAALETLTELGGSKKP